jgi:hypothetical protein
MTTGGCLEIKSDWTQDLSLGSVPFPDLLFRRRENVRQVSTLWRTRLMRLFLPLNIYGQGTAHRAIEVTVTKKKEPERFMYR